MAQVGVGVPRSVRYGLILPISRNSSNQRI
ncbi:unnamed protein product [Hymenolepis diminuta]|uniref:Uncharacterized protein n=1 Tax=Hymenolepis diminuta TaxID=6216 RepID=A0A0R3SZQ8_HYMDI|nr:unnamed protein product [Hymenolepis diminuta]